MTVVLTLDAAVHLLRVWLHRGRRGTSLQYRPLRLNSSRSIVGHVGGILVVVVVVVVAVAVAVAAAAAAAVVY